MKIILNDILRFMLLSINCLSQKKKYLRLFKIEYQNNFKYIVNAFNQQCISFVQMQVVVRMNIHIRIYILSVSYPRWFRTLILVIMSKGVSQIWFTFDTCYNDFMQFTISVNSHNFIIIYLDIIYIFINFLIITVSLKIRTELLVLVHGH